MSTEAETRDRRAHRADQRQAQTPGATGAAPAVTAEADPQQAAAHAVADAGAPVADHPAAPADDLLSGHGRGDSLIHVTLGEPIEPPARSPDTATSPAGPAAAAGSGSDPGTEVEPAGTRTRAHAADTESPIDRATLRERTPDIDLGERRRHPRPPRNAPFVPPVPLPIDLQARRHLIDEEERQIDAADEKLFHEQSLAFERSDNDDETSDLTATSLKTDRDIVYRDMGGHDLSVSVDAFDEMDASVDAASARTAPGSYGLLVRVYDSLVGLLRRIPRWFGIRDEGKER